MRKTILRAMRVWASTAAGAALASVTLLAPLPARAAPLAVWTGGGADSGWSNAANWDPASVPTSGSDLVFHVPNNCTSSCENHNNLTGFEASSLSMDAAAQGTFSLPGYIIDGFGFTLGGGGLTYTMRNPPSGPLFGLGSDISSPITLGAPQTWSVTGEGLFLNTSVAGSAALSIGLSPATGSGNSTPGFLVFGEDAEVGHVTITGSVPSDAGSNGNVFLGGPGAGGSLNGTNANPVTVTNAGLFAWGGSKVGPLTLSGGDLTTGLRGSGGCSVTGAGLVVAGGVTMDSTTFVGFHFDGNVLDSGHPQVAATGDVALGGAAMSIMEGPSSPCAPQGTGTVLTLVTTSSGTVTGQFTDPTTGQPIPNGGQVEEGSYFFRVNYYPDRVTATVIDTPLVSGTQAMDGNLKVAQGSTLSAGFDFSMPGVHPAAMVGFTGTQVKFQATCVSGTPGAATITVNIPDQTYNDPANSSGWYPSGDQNTGSTYQGTTTVPSFCDTGALVSLQHGGQFSSLIGSTDTTNNVNVRWHYADGLGGGWSGTDSVIPG